MVSSIKPTQIVQVTNNYQRAKQTVNCGLRQISRRYVLISLLVNLIIAGCTDTPKSEQSSITEFSNDSKVLKIWWDKGFTQEEDEALKQLVSQWEKQTGNKIKLSLYSTDELPRKIQREIRAGNLPDIVTSYTADRELIPRLSWEGKLADVSDVIEPLKSFYPKEILKTVQFYNKVTQKRSYYALPMSQATLHIFYWRDLLKQINRTESDIPKNWDAFWEFWKQTQSELRTKQLPDKKQNIYGLGFTFSIASADTYYFFEQILEAYDVQILDSQDKLQLDDPKVRQGIINSLKWYTKFYQQGYVPPDAVNWLNPDNNRSLLNRSVVMTPNNSLSIPAAVRQNLDVYNQKLGILELPNKPNGLPMRYLITVKQVFLFADSKKQKLAKEFLAYLIKPEVMGDYLKVSGGRHLPVLTSEWKDPFWKDSKDIYLSTAAKIFLNRETRPFYFVQNPAYSLVLKDNVWGKAINRIVVDKISPEQATDEAIAQIKQIFDQWR
ncbi:MAG: ABC transporter substrate-binding protein [Nostoc sp. ChiSLP02]|nr:ABC transporter substrate-binding protein [Nostoc sp. DedSLP05]MDZ8097622.1 ABC transporter substrate-binding protein [Nostoc sp. DedSLP01]MDZ8186759.1 ABC transporter substrate-binding protein [Nostoc sp. ChiSLP02]